MTRTAARKAPRTAARPPAIPAALEPTGIDLDGVFSSDELSPALERIYAEMGVSDGQSYVVVHKKLPDTREARIWKGDPSDYDIDQLAKQFGSADYTVRVYVMDATTGRYACRGCATFTMELSPTDEARVKAAREGAPVLESGSTPPSMEKMLTAALDAQQQKFVAVLAPLMQSMNSRQNMFGELKEFATVLGIVKPAASAAADPMAMFGAFASMMRIMKELTPAAPLTEDDVGPNALLMKAMEVFGSAMSKAQGGAPPAGDGELFSPAGGAPAPGMTVLSTAAVPVMPAHQVNNNTEDDDDMLMMKAQLAMMIAAAGRDSPVESYADIVYDNAPDDIIDKLQKPEWFAELVKLEPKCAQHEAWFSKVREAVLILITEEGSAAG